MDALNAHNLEDTLELQERSAEVDEKLLTKMNMTACDIIRSYLHSI